MIYELLETGRASALFAGWQDSVVWSALQGVMGKIYVDSLEKPESGVAMLGDFCFLSGKTESEVISGALANGASEEVILVPQNDDWAQMWSVTGRRQRKRSAMQSKRNLGFLI